MKILARNLHISGIERDGDADGRTNIDLFGPPHKKPPRQYLYNVSGNYQYRTGNVKEIWNVGASSLFEGSLPGTGVCPPRQDSRINQFGCRYLFLGWLQDRL